MFFSRHLRSGLLVLPLLALLFAGCSKAANPWQGARPGQKRVLVSFAPIYCMTHAVAGDDAYVLCLLTTQGPHGYTDTPADMLKLHRAELILTNGLGLEPFMARLVHGAGNRSAKVVKLGDTLDEKLLLHPGEDDGHAHAGHKHAHSAHDPHIWLGPPQARAMVEKIAEELAQLDPAHKAGYAKRAAAFVAELEQLQREGRALLQMKKNKRLLTMHESLAYFAQAFGLDIVGSVKTSTGDDPSANDLAKLAELCKAKDVSVIAIEPQYSAQLASTLQDYLRHGGHPVALVEVDPLETAPLAPGSVNPDPHFYLHKMRENIQALAKALP
jgi:zinc transport system substrate-binding protein